jgi:hypothetical protein
LGVGSAYRGQRRVQGSSLRSPLRKNLRPLSVYALTQQSGRQGGMLCMRSCRGVMCCGRRRRRRSLVLRCGVCSYIILASSANQMVTAPPVVHCEPAKVCATTQHSRHRQLIHYRSYFRDIIAPWRRATKDNNSAGRFQPCMRMRQRCRCSFMAGDSKSSDYALFTRLYQSSFMNSTGEEI